LGLNIEKELTNYYFSSLTLEYALL